MLKNKNVLSFFSFILIFGISACAETRNKNTDGDTATSALDFNANSETDTQETSQSPLANNANFTQIQGIWNSPCEQGSVEYVQRHLNITNGTFHQENQFHPDANCINTIKAPFVIKGTYEIGNDFITTNGLIVKEIDFIIPSDGADLRLTDIVYIDNSNNLYFGVKDKTSSNRPIVLDLNYTYTK